MCGENTDDDWIDYVECREGALEERAYTEDQHCYFITVVCGILCHATAKPNGVCNRYICLTYETPQVQCKRLNAGF